MKLKVVLENQPPSEFGDLVEEFTRAKHEALAFVSKVEDDDAPASSGSKKGARRGKYFYFKIVNRSNLFIKRMLWEARYVQNW